MEEDNLIIHAHRLKLCKKSRQPMKKQESKERSIFISTAVFAEAPIFSKRWL